MEGGPLQSMFRAHVGLKTMDSEEQQTLRWVGFPPVPSSLWEGEEQKRKRVVIPSFLAFDPCLNRTLCLNESLAESLSSTLGKSWVRAQELEMRYNDLSLSSALGLVCHHLPMSCDTSCGLMLAISTNKNSVIFNLGLRVSIGANGYKEQDVMSRSLKHKSNLRH